MRSAPSFQDLKCSSLHRCTDAMPHFCANVMASSSLWRLGIVEVGSSLQGSVDAADPGRGNCVLTAKANPIRTDDIHRQACIPPERKRAPDSSVPMRRPAAFAMVRCGIGVLLNRRGNALHISADNVRSTAHSLIPITARWSWLQSACIARKRGASLSHPVVIGGTGSKGSVNPSGG